MATFLTLALYPDQAMKPVVEENPEEEEAWVLPGGGLSDIPGICLVSGVQAAPLDTLPV
jgi:hypothetical protein